MALDPKELKKLAKACREAGIKSYKADGIEFTLSDQAPPVSPYKKRQAAKAPIQGAQSAPGEQIESDGWDNLSEEQKLFYSARDQLFENEGEQQ